MDILFITDRDLSGKSGSNIATKEMVTSFCRYPNSDLHLICSEPTNEIPGTFFEGINTYFLSSYYQGSSALTQCILLKYLYSIVSEVHPNYIILRYSDFMMAFPFFHTFFSKKNYKTKLLIRGPINIREDKWMLPKRSIVRFNTLYADDIYVAHEEIRETVKRYGNNTSKIELLPNAVNPDKMIPHDKREVRKEIGLNPNDFWIGFVGSIKDRHCLEELFKAVKNIRKNQRPSILIIGEGPRKSVLESLSDKLGLNTRFVGFVQHGKVDKYLSSCDVSYAVVDPDEPSNPIKCYESCACECPVITSKKSEFEFIEKNDLGFVVNHPGVETLVSAIKEAQNTSEDEMQDMGRRARRYVKQNYTWDQFASRVIDS